MDELVRDFVVDYLQAEEKDKLKIANTFVAECQRRHFLERYDNRLVEHEEKKLIVSGEHEGKLIEVYELYSNVVKPVVHNDGLTSGKEHGDA